MLIRRIPQRESHNFMVVMRFLLLALFTLHYSNSWFQTWWTNSCLLILKYSVNNPWFLISKSFKVVNLQWQIKESRNMINNSSWEMLHQCFLANHRTLLTTMKINLMKIIKIWTAIKSRNNRALGSNSKSFNLMRNKRMNRMILRVSLQVKNILPRKKAQ